MKNILPYKNTLPTIHPETFIAPTAVVIGDVQVGKGTNIWYGAVLRGDVNKIRIGDDTNIQDGCVVHVATYGQGTHVGSRVTVGHMALLHDCTVGDDAYIGMQACVMDGAVVEAGAFVAAGALVTPKKTIPSGQLWGGSPAKYLRDLNDDDRKMMKWSAPHYVELGKEHAKSTS